MRVMSHDHVHHSHTAPAAPTAMLLPEKSCGDCCGVPSPAAAAVPVVSAGLRYRVPAMDCASEESEIRRALEGVAGIRGLGFRLGERSLRIDAADDVAHTAVAAIRRIGYEIQPWPESGPVTTAANGAVAPEDLTHARGTGLARLLAALALATGAELLSFLAPDTLAFKLIGLAVAGAAIGLAGFDVFKKGLTALLHGRLNINALMSVAVAGAFVIGQWPEAAMVMALYAIAELIEARAVDRARNAIGGLLALAPEAASVRQGDGSWATVPVGSVPLDAIVRVRPGERLAMDGVVVEGASAIDQAPVTGESIPVDKAVGDPVFAGTINATGTLSSPGHRRGIQFHPRTHHPCRRTGAGQPRAHAALRRPFRSDLHAGGLRAGARGGLAAAPGCSRGPG